VAACGSASFSLGVLQALSRAGVLDRSITSPPSPAAATSGMAVRVAASRERERPAGSLARSRRPLAGRQRTASAPRLRAYIKYLTPHTGILSADVWTLIGTMLRNLFVNWMLLIPIIGAAAMLPGLYLGLLGLPSQPELISREALESWCDTDWILMTVLIAIAGTYAALQLPSLGRRPYGLRGFLGWFLVPVLLVHVLLSCIGPGPRSSTTSPALLPQMLFGGGRHGAARGSWAASSAAGSGSRRSGSPRPRPAPSGRFAGFKAHGSRLMLAANHPHLFAVLDLTTTLGCFSADLAVHRLASREMTDEDREWWARTGAWILICAVAWGAVSTVAILGPLACAGPWTR
jgi:hypothetical protein